MPDILSNWKGEPHELLYITLTPINLTISAKSRLWTNDSPLITPSLWQFNLTGLTPARSLREADKHLQVDYLTRSTRVCASVGLFTLDCTHPIHYSSICANFGVFNSYAKFCVECFLQSSWKYTYSLSVSTQRPNSCHRFDENCSKERIIINKDHQRGRKSGKSHANVFRSPITWMCWRPALRIAIPLTR